MLSDFVLVNGVTDKFQEAVFLKQDQQDIKIIKGSLAIFDTNLGIVEYNRDSRWSLSLLCIWFINHFRFPDMLK